MFGTNVYLGFKYCFEVKLERSTLDALVICVYFLEQWRGRSVYFSTLHGRKSTLSQQVSRQKLSLYTFHTVEKVVLIKSFDQKCYEVAQLPLTWKRDVSSAHSRFCGRKILSEQRMTRSISMKRICANIVSFRRTEFLDKSYCRVYTCGIISRTAVFDIFVEIFLFLCCYYGYFLRRVVWELSRIN